MIFDNFNLQNQVIIKLITNKLVNPLNKSFSASSKILQKKVQKMLKNFSKFAQKLKTFRLTNNFQHLESFFKKKCSKMLNKVQKLFKNSKPTQILYEKNDNHMFLSYYMNYNYMFFVGMKYHLLSPSLFL